MSIHFTRRDFIKSAMAGSALCAGCSNQRGGFLAGSKPAARIADLISPGCRGTKVRVGRVFLASPQGQGLWPTPTLDVAAEKARYEADMSRMRELNDVEFVGNQLVTSVDQARDAVNTMNDVDGILVIHVSMGTAPLLQQVLAARKPTILFAAPYSGHEWTGFGAVVKQNPLFDCMLTQDTAQLAVAVRPFRAIHHLREAMIINVTERPWPADAMKAAAEKFGTHFVIVGRERMMKYYDAVPDDQAQAEAKQLIRGAMAVVEPSRDEVLRSCRLALAFERLMDDERATVITTDCYGSMYHQLPAFPCVGNVRLNDMGLGGICESDLNSAITHILFQGLVGRPGFISDPTMDESQGSIILAHCLGSRKMDGPAGPTAPYRLRSIMERQEGCVPQVFMRKRETVTQAICLKTSQIRYFTGKIIDVPDTDRGCRTKITVKIDGDPAKLWLNWSNGLHRVTCYGNIEHELRLFARFKDLEFVNEAV